MASKPMHTSLKNIKSYLERLNSQANIRYGGMVTSDKLFDVWSQL
jgi:hypothetical protein